ncbi:MAG TPA: hypothetical protein VFO17_11255 [Acidimicrobiia bacterium]|jgi:hypothetical protein|nr:hypothetical protein [Acidimicrobiia bacterium]
MKALGLILILVVAGGCTPGTTADSGPESTVPATTATPTSILPPIVECPGVGEFEEGGGIADIPGEGSDSRLIGQMSWEASDQCESFHIDFATSEGAPATAVPEIRVDHLESFQVIRVSMNVESTVVTDQLVETAMVKRLYVVRSLSGGMFLDLHLSAPAAVRVSVSSSPAQLTLDLRPGFVPFNGAATIGEDVVLTSPALRTGLDQTVQFIGYARTSDGNVSLEATQDGTVVAEAEGSAGSSDTWGEYRIGVTLPTGPVSVVLGEPDADDVIQGINLDLSVG